MAVQDIIQGTVYAIGGEKQSLLYAGTIVAQTLWKYPIAFLLGFKGSPNEMETTPDTVNETKNMKVGNR